MTANFDKLRSLSGAATALPALAALGGSSRIAQAQVPPNQKLSLAALRAAVLT